MATVMTMEKKIFEDVTSDAYSSGNETYEHFRKRKRYYFISTSLIKKWTQQDYLHEHMFCVHFNFYCLSFENA